MVRQSLQASGRFRSLPSWFWWTLVLGGIAAGVLLVEFLETPSLVPGIQFEDIFIFKLIGYGNLLLVGATVLYLGHLSSGSDTVGLWASRVAGVGAFVSLLALTIRWIETFLLERPGHFAFSSLYEMVALFGALTVVIYLFMERTYSTRSAGAFVMLIVFGGVLFQIWLAANEGSIPGGRIRVLKSYWMHAHVMGSFIGYGAFAVAAAMGAAYLVGIRRGLYSQRELARLDDLMHHAILLGFPVFALATTLGAFWAYQAWGRYWEWDPKETWALVVCAVYASYFFFRYVNRWNGGRMAWWSIGGFAMTVFCFVGVRAFMPGLHSGVTAALPGNDQLTIFTSVLFQTQRGVWT